MSLTRRTLSGLKWTMLERIGVQGTDFVVKIILARILLPEEFGIIGTVAILLILARVFTDGGLGMAIVRTKDIERKDISTVFFTNVTVALLLLAAMWACGPMVATFFEEPVLEFVLPALGLGILVSSFGQTQLKMLQKNMEFSKLLKISLPATITSGIVGIAMALTGFGVWALVGLRLTQNTVFTSLVWVFCNPQWRPRMEFSFQSLRKLASFSFAKLFHKIAYQTARNVQGLVVAKAYGMEDLGYYNRAQSFQKQPVTAVASSLGQVLFPVFSEIQDDPDRIRSALRTGIPALAFIVVPAMILLITVAKPLIIVLLTAKWIESVQYLRLFPLLGITFCLNSVKVNVIDGRGTPRLVFILGIVRPALQLIVLLFTYRYGILAMLIGQISVAWFNAFIINDLVVSRLAHFPVLQQWSDFFPYLFVAGFACGVASLLNLAPLPFDILQLIAQTVLFFGIYLLLCQFLRLQGMQQIVKRVPFLNNSSTS